MKGTAYSLPPAAHEELQARVDRIETKEQGILPNPKEIKEQCATINMRSVVQTLPEQLSEEEFTEILMLAMLTECATDSYAQVFDDSARLYDASWLGQFNQRVWVPDEHTHQVPFKEFLKGLGFSEEELDRLIRITQEECYDHTGGKTPVELTTYGKLQELLTDNWYGLIARLLKPAAPLAAHFTNQIKRRETLHRVWYRDLTALQIRANPDLLPLVARSVVQFQMPGNVFSKTKNIQQKTRQLLEKMEANMQAVWKEFVENFDHIFGYSPVQSGKFVVELGVQKGFRFLRPAIHSSALCEFLSEAARVSANLPHRRHSALYEKTVGRLRNPAGDAFKRRIVR